MAYKSIEITGPATVVNQTIKQNQFYTGYSTVDPAATSVRLYDYSLIKQDILNQFNTRQGERVMKEGILGRVTGKLAVMVLNIKGPVAQSVRAPDS